MNATTQANRNAATSVASILGLAVGFVGMTFAGNAWTSTTATPPSDGSRASAFTVPAGSFYANCSMARQAGVAPMRRGEPGYAKHLDRDADGIACE